MKATSGLQACKLRMLEILKLVVKYMYHGKLSRAQILDFRRWYDHESLYTQATQCQQHNINTTGLLTATNRLMQAIYYL